MTSRDDEQPRPGRRRIDESSSSHGLLAAEIDRYLRRGYRVASETATSVSLVKPKRFGCLPFVLLFLLGIFPAVIYVAWYASKRDEAVYLRLEDGQVRRGGARRARRDGGRGAAAATFSLIRRGSVRLWGVLPTTARLAIAGAAVVAVALVAGIFLLGGRDGDVRPPPVVTPSASTQAPTKTASVSPTRTATPTPTATPETYTVVAGDTLYKIATRFGVGLAELVKLNGIADPSLIEVGQSLILPSAVAADPSRGGDYERFTRLLEEGAGCGVLFDARAKIDKTDADYADATADLRSVECFSAQSTRGEEQADGRSPNWVTQYRLSHWQCSFSAEQLYAEARTRDPQRAAEWLSEIFVPGDGRDGSIAGCYDALVGIASRYP